MPSVEVKPSPRGVPGAVSDISRIESESLTYPGAGGDLQSSPERPTPPLSIAEQLSCPLLAAVGVEDHNPSPEIAERLRMSAQRSGQEVVVGYRPQPAAKLWQQIVPFLDKHLTNG
jgi:hypothetical protein